MNAENQIPLNIDFFIKRSLELISYENVEMLRISFFEFHPSYNIMVSAGNQISREEVDRLYEGKRPPLTTSLQNQMDLFYENCLMNNAKTEIMHFFQAKLLTPDQHSSVTEQFFKNAQKRSMKLLWKNNKKLRTRMMSFEEKFSDILHDAEKCQIQREKYFEYYQKAIFKRSDDNKMSSFLPNILEYNLFHGFRATWEFDLQQGKPNEDKIIQIKNMNKNHRIYGKYDGWLEEIRKSITQDLNLRPEVKSAKSVDSSFDREKLKLTGFRTELRKY